MRLLDYLDFDVAICREGDRYIAHVLQSPGGEAQAEFQIPFTKLETENFLLGSANQEE